MTFHYVVRGVECAESANSNEASITPGGDCTVPPLFAGLASATNGGLTTCTNLLSWSAATTDCGGTIAYDVFRSETPGFVPGPLNRIATGLTGTSLNDDLGLVTGTTYHYVVRAVETKDLAVADSNTVERSAKVTGTVTPAVAYFDDLDGNRPPNAASWWIATTQSGTAGTINLTSGCHFQSSSQSWRFGAASTACGGTYPISTQATLSLGGNGTPPGINGFVLPAGATGTMTFRVWYEFEPRYDGAWLAYSTTGAAGPWTKVGDAVAAGVPYISAGGYDDTLRSDTTIRIWTGTNMPANGALKAVTVNLDGVSGNTIWFAFRFYTDLSINEEGFYADDVRLDVNSYDTCTTGSSTPGPAASYIVTAPSPTHVGTPVTATFTAVDALGRVATGYAGQAAITSADPLATLPSPVTFTAGVATGIVTFGTLGTQGLTATDGAVPGITGTGNILVHPAAALRYYPLTPCRVVDTREAAGMFGGPPIEAAGAADRAFPIAASLCGVPSTARAVSLNVTVVAPPAPGALLVYPGGTSPGAASTITFAAGRTRATMSVVGVSVDGLGSVRVRNGSAGIVDLVIDTNGYFAP